MCRAGAQGPPQGTLPSLGIWEGFLEEETWGRETCRSRVESGEPPWLLRDIRCIKSEGRVGRRWRWHLISAWREPSGPSGFARGVTFS